MRKIILLATMFVATLATAQVSTSEEEYNYLTKGLKIQEEAGLGDQVKKGYELTPLISDEHQNFKIDYFEFKNIAENKTKAILIKLTKVKSGTDKVAYLCMPINNKDLWKKFNYSVNPKSFDPSGLGSSQSEALGISLKRLFPLYLDKIHNN